MYAKSFLALDGNGRLTGARTAQAAPYAHYTCHLCGSALRYHPQYDSKRAARTVLTGMCYSFGNATRQGSSSLTRFIGQSAITSSTWRR